MPSFGRDLSHAARTLRKSPGFAITAIITIALGIGATTAIFSVVNTVLLRPLPYRDPSGLVLIQSDMTARSVVDFPIPPADFADMREQGTLFDGIAGVFTFRNVLRGDGDEPEQVRVMQVTTNILTVLGLGTSLGRGFIESDGTPFTPPPQGPQGQQPAPDANAPPPPHQMAILSHAFWQRRFGGDTSVIGKTIRLGNGNVLTEIVGVLQPGVRFLWPPTNNIDPDPDILTALRVDFAAGSRINVFIRAVARLKDGAGLEQARAQMQSLNEDLKQRFPIKATAGLRLRVEPMQQYLVADVRQGLLALMGAVVFVLLITCANVANLLLVRAAQRERELVVRAALGASRTDLVVQMFAESLLIAGTGAALGIALAVGGLGVLRSFAPAHLPRVGEVRVDALVLVFAIVLSLACSVLFGLLPAWRASRPDAGAALRSAGRVGALAAGRVMRNSVVIAEVALAFVLLVGSGLMVRSMIALQHTDPGYDPDGVLTFLVQPAQLNSEGQRHAFARNMEDRLGALPGVRAVTAVDALPFGGFLGLARWGTEEAVADPSKFRQTAFHAVQPSYFETMRVRLREGRLFTEADNDTGRVDIIVDEVMARKAFPGRSAVGQRLLVRLRGNDPEWLNVIGVVSHERYESLADEGREAIYVTDGFFRFGATQRWMIRTSGDPMSLSGPARAIVKELQPAALVAEARPLSVLVDKAMAPTRFALTAISIFAVIAALLAAVGLYGVLSTTVRQRTAEIGIRMVFGAEQSSIFKLVVGQGLKLSVAGIVAGVLAALVLTRVISTLLVGVRPTDPLTIAGISGAFLLIAAFACWLPARRAASLDPSAALREE